MALAQPAAAARLGRYTLQVFKGPAGSRSVFNKISDDGTAVGQQLRSDGTSRSLRLSRRRGGGGSPLAGRQSALVGINVRDQAAGSVLGPGPMTPFFLSGGRLITLSMVGNANAITFGPLVAVTATGADGVRHVFVWNPLRGSVRDYGPGNALGIRFDGVVVGRSLSGQAAYWTGDGVMHALGFMGSLIQVNLFGRVVGFTTQSGGPTPIMLDLGHPEQVTNLRLPPGWRFGTAKGLADNGLIVGDAFRNPTGGLPSEGIVWASATKPVPLQTLARGRASRGVQISDASGVDDNGLIVGSVVRRAAARASDTPQEDAYVATPELIAKLENLRSLTRNLRSAGLYGGENVIARLRDVEFSLARREFHTACLRLDELGNGFRRLRLVSTGHGIDESFQQPIREGGSKSVEELKSELGRC
jgi:hypothetical protein